jgi:Sec7-like guanine-nucleotide exchange factor
MENEIQMNPPRVYLLQKLVEVAWENIGRNLLIWMRIWVHIGGHLTQVGCSQNLELALYVVDLLRQLAMKFLEKDELSNYTFQSSLLKPFGDIFQAHKFVSSFDFLNIFLINILFYLSDSSPPIEPFLFVI